LPHEATRIFLLRQTPAAEIETVTDHPFRADREADMLEGDVPRRDRYLTFETKDRVNPSFGGLLFPTRERELGE
jgi:hypothetical protein